jgi:hypothetical protein
VDLTEMYKIWYHGYTEQVNMVVML